MPFGHSDFLLTACGSSVPFPSFGWMLSKSAEVTWATAGEDDAKMVGLVKCNRHKTTQQTRVYPQDFHFLLQDPRTAEGFQKGSLKGCLKGSLKGL